jgi:2',5'-phosphodiesterase
MSGGSDSFAPEDDLSASDSSLQSSDEAPEAGLPAKAAVRVLSYNVLSSSLCEADYHVKCKPGDLDERTRLRRVVDKLGPEMERGAIICLQEVSTQWAGTLHSHMSRNDYHMIHMGYGGKFDGYMGCAIAFPTGKYTLETCKIDRVADLKKWPRLPSPGRRERLKASLVSIWRRWKNIKPPVDPYFDTKKRANQLIMTRLRDKEAGATFCLATYHMPCQFRVPEVMVSHAALSLRHLQRLARTDPLIFCGDFNFKPGDSPYRLVTQGSLPKSDPHYPTLPAVDDWAPKIEYPMQSAYLVANGAEPDYTNWAYTRGSPEDFMGCLDYIFFSEGVKVCGVAALPTPDGSPGSVVFSRVFPLYVE